jgi:outer membrane protein assembly factor BamE
MPDSYLRNVRLPLLALVLLGLFGCSSLSGAGGVVMGAVKPYKIDVIQGNVVTREQLAALQPGMPRTQVRDVLGSALLTSVFHANRWDYVFTLKQGSDAAQNRRVTVYFKNDVMERVEADELPSESEFVATLKSPELSGSIPLLQASPEDLAKYPPSSKPVVDAAPTAPLPSSYPPLEPVAR